jgi:hypothetical protein
MHQGEGGAVMISSLFSQVSQSNRLSLEELRAEAENSLWELETEAQDLVDDLQRTFPILFDNTSFEIGPLKDIERARLKMLSELGGNPCLITDLARARIIVDTPEQIEAIRLYMIAHAGRLDIRKIEDRFAVPTDTHYRDINIRICLPGGHVAEIQINQRDMLAASQETHEPYRLIQLIDRRVESENRRMTEDEALEWSTLMEKVRDIHDSMAGRKNLNKLLSVTGIEKLAEDRRERVSPPYYNAHTGEVSRCWSAPKPF